MLTIGLSGQPTSRNRSQRSAIPNATPAESSQQNRGLRFQVRATYSHSCGLAIARHMFLEFGVIRIERKSLLLYLHGLLIIPIRKVRFRQGIHEPPFFLG